MSATSNDLGLRYADERPRRRRRWPWVVVGVVVAFVLLVGGCVAVIGNAAENTADDVERVDREAADEVALTSCKALPPLGLWEVRGAVVNASESRSDYFIEATLRRGDVQVASITAYAANVEPGATAEWTAQSSVDGEGVKCEVVDVNRIASL